MEVIVSKSSSHNRRYIREALKAHDRRGERAYLIVPEQFTMESDLALLRTLEKKLSLIYVFIHLRRYLEK